MLLHCAGDLLLRCASKRIPAIVGCCWGALVAAVAYWAAIGEQPSCEVFRLRFERAVEASGRCKLHRWTLHPTYCQDVRISGVTFDTQGANSDGIDVDSCQRVIINGCAFTTGDDNIAIKSGKGQEGVKVGRPCEDIIITNCTFIKGYVSIALGSELSGGIRRVRISHCTFKQGLAALQLKSREGRAGYLEDITAEHLIVGPTPLLEITANYRFNPDPQGVSGVDGLTQFRNIRISDVRLDSKRLLSIEGTTEKPVDGIQISRVTGTCKQGSVIQNATNVILKDIRLDGISGSQYFTNNVAGTGFEGAVPLRERPPQTDKSLADAH